MAQPYDVSFYVVYVLCCFLLFFSRDGSGTNCEVSRGVGLALCEAFEQADKVNSSPLWSPSFVSPKTYQTFDWINSLS